MKKIMLLLVIAVILGGCGSNQTESDEDRAQKIVKDFYYEYSRCIVDEDREGLEELQENEINDEDWENMLMIKDYYQSTEGYNAEIIYYDDEVLVANVNTDSWGESACLLPLKKVNGKWISSLEVLENYGDGVYDE